MGVSSRSGRRSDVVAGLACGLAAVAMWGVYLATTRAGIASGLAPVDLVVLRYAPAALIMVPWWLSAGVRDLGGVGWARGAWLAACAGPVFIILAAGGYLFAPLSHGAVIQPSTAALASILLAVALLGERVPASRWIGVAAILGGIALISTGSDASFVSDRPWIGAAMFMASGVMWGLFTVSIRRWDISGTAATGAVAIVSALVTLPAVALLGTFERVLALTPPEIALQMLVHGVLSGVLAIVAFGQAVRLLGAARGALFPALVPAATLVAGIPISGEVPGPLEWTGAGLATLGLSVAMGAFSRRARRPAQAPRPPRPSRRAA